MALPQHSAPWENMPPDADTLGFIAGVITTVAFVPQVVRVWRTRSADDISVWMLMLLISGVSLWLVYGLLLWRLPIILANAVTLALILTIALLKFIYRQKSY